MLIPFPSSVICDFELQPHDASSVYVEVEGTLEEVLVKPGQRVEQGQLLAKLKNIDLEIEIQQLEGQHDATAVQLKSLRQQRRRSEQDGNQIEVVRERLEALKEQLAKKREDAKRLDIVAPGGWNDYSAPLANKIEPRVSKSNWQVGRVRPWIQKILEQRWEPKDRKTCSARSATPTNGKRC